MEVTGEAAAAKIENMQYYHIAPPDLGRDISPALEDDDVHDDEDDDPNWLMMTGTRNHRKSDGRTNVILRQTCTADPPRNGGNRLSRLMEGVATVLMGTTGEGDEDADVIVGADGAASAPLPAYYQDDPIAARICELFDEMEPLEKMFAQNNNVADDNAEAEFESHPAVVRLRPKSESRGIFGRKKQTVSGYFSDWTKWLRGPETSAAARGAANEGSGKCNGRE